jgi:ATP-dependent helicase/DNAse subunit B
MKIITGPLFQEKMEDLSRSLTNTSETITIITEHVTYLEDVLLKDHPFLFHVEVKSLSAFCYDLLTNTRSFTKQRLPKTLEMYTIRHLLKTHHFDYFTFSENPYPLIDEIMKTLSLIHQNNLSLDDLAENASLLTKEKCAELKVIDDALRELPYDFSVEDEVMDLLDQVKTPVIVIGDDYPALAQRKLFAALDHYVPVTMYLTCHQDDLMAHFYEGDIFHDERETLVTKHLYDLETVTPEEKAEVLVGGSLYHEALKVTASIKARLVDEQAHYNDFAIIVHDESYKDYLKEIFDGWGYPHDIAPVDPFYYNNSYKTIVAYLEKATDNTYRNLSKELLTLELDDDYRTLIEAIDFDEETTPTDYRLFLEENLSGLSKPVEPHDCIHVCDFNEALFADAKYIYVMGLNEGDVPAIMKDEGLLLDEDFVFFHTRPLNTQERLTLHLMEIMRTLTNPHKLFTFSFARSDNDGKEKMPSTLMNRLFKLFDTKTVNPDLSIHAPRLYANNGKLPDFALNEAIAHYDNQAAIIDEQYRDALGKGMSITRLETYNKCPFQYYLRYGLKIMPNYEETLSPADLGSLCHYIMEKGLDHEEDLNKIGYDYVKEHLDKQYQASALNRYFIDHLIEDMAINLKVVKAQFGSFEVKEKEYQVKGHLGEIPVLGAIDRVDTYNDCVRIIDYKSGTKTLNLNYVRQGFNIQMLVYMDLLLKQEKDLKPGAMLYYSMKREILRKKDVKTLSLHSEVSQEDAFKQFKMNGYGIDEEPYVLGDALAVNSTNIRFTNAGKPRKDAPVIDEETFNAIMAEITTYITDLYDQLRAGHVEIYPSQSDNKSDTEIYPCTFCDYKSVCLFDVFVNENKVIKSHLDAPLKKGDN